MRAATIIILGTTLIAFAAPAAAQSRRQDVRTRQDIARAQGIPPGHLPPANQCRVWYDNRPNGRQPAPTSCRQAEALASRDRNARVIYGEDVYWDSRYGNTGSGRNDRAVPRGSVRAPGGYNGDRDEGRDSRYYRNTPAFQNGYRDGMTKGREDAEDRDRYDVDRHRWYRSATRGYESRYGNRNDYTATYREGFEAGYAEGYRVYGRR